jgi:hypothetical protein
MHDFPVEHTGNYLLQEDPLGGTSYVTRLDWSDSTGKFILGRDAAVGIYGERNRKYFPSLKSTIYNNTDNQVSGHVKGYAANIEYVDFQDENREIRIGSNTKIELPNSYKIDWKSTHYGVKYSEATSTRENGAVLFAAGEDTNIVLDGGELYGNSDTNFITGDVYDTPVGDSIVTLEGLDVIADSLQQWYVYITSGTGSGQMRRVNYNDATAGGNTVCYLTTPWQTKPDGTSKYRLSPMEEWQSAIDFGRCKDITIKNMNIHDFPGDGICITACENVLIENCTISTPFRWFVESNETGQVHNLVGRQGITLAGGNETRYNLVRPDTTLAYRAGWDTLRNIRITKCKVLGGYPGGIDLEPLGRLYVENLEISECEISNTPGKGGSAIIVYMADSSIVKNLIIRDNNIKTDGVGIWLTMFGSVRTDSTNTSEYVDATEYEIDVNDGSVFSNDDYITIGDDIEFCRIDTVMGNTIRLYQSGSVRATYNNCPAPVAHLVGTTIYKTTGTGSNRGYWENVQIVGNTITPISAGGTTVGIYVLGGAPYHKLNISNNRIYGHGGRGFEVTCPTYDVEIKNNLIYNNGSWSDFYNSSGRRIFIDGNIFRDNYVVADSSGTQLYISGCDVVTATNNTFICSNDSTIARPMMFYSCDSVIATKNIAWGHNNDGVYYWDVTNALINDNYSGFTVSGTSSDADVTYEYGTTLPGDTTACAGCETKRVSLNFTSYRDVIPNTVGAKLVMQSIATPGYGAKDWLVQTGNLLFYTLGDFALSVDDARLRALITKNGLGLADSSYINFFPKNSASNIDPDTLYKYVGELGYGFRDSSGTIQYKNLGGSWANIGSGSGSGGTGDVVGPALGATDDAIAVYDGTTGKAIKNSLATISTGGELTVPVIYAKPTIPIGFIVTKENPIAGTDSCLTLGVVNGRGTATLYDGGGRASVISSTTVGSTYPTLFTNPYYFAFKGGAGTAAIYISAEKTFAAADSFAALQVNNGCGELYLASSDGLPEYGTITMAADGTMDFGGPGPTRFDFSAPISVGTDNIFVGVKTGTYDAAQGHVWISGDTLFHATAASSADFWVKTGTSTKH